MEKDEIGISTLSTKISEVCSQSLGNFFTADAANSLFPDIKRI